MSSFNTDTCKIPMLIIPQKPLILQELIFKIPSMVFCQFETVPSKIKTEAPLFSSTSVTLIPHIEFLSDQLPAVQLKLIMGLDIPDCPPKCPTPRMAVIRVTDMVLMINQTKVPVGKLHTVDVPDMPGVIADQSHIKRIFHNHREIIPVD